MDGHYAPPPHRPGRVDLDDRVSGSGGIGSLAGGITPQLPPAPAGALEHRAAPGQQQDQGPERGPPGQVGYRGV